MHDNVIERSYPLTFRKNDAEVLGNSIRHRRSIEIIGMKRVGISNFLRFFLYHNSVIPTYISTQEKHLFIPVDLNDLIERELHPFWILTFKRLLDAIEQTQISSKIYSEISTLFLKSIQTQDLFLTFENVKQATQLLLSENIMPTFFFIRFDRLEPAINSAFFNNLQGFIENSNHKVSFVFTSFRPLDQIQPEVFSRQELASFSDMMDIKPADKKDIATIYSTLQNKYNFCFTKSMVQTLLELSGGHVQYLHLILVILNEKIGRQNINLNKNAILEKITDDERITLQSEEIWESLSKEEQEALLKIQKGKPVKNLPSYILRTGIVSPDCQIFSPLLDHYVSKMSQREEAVEFTKKEFLLYTLLVNHRNEVCEREDIIHEVWPEYEELGVSDWTIDRLIARLRSKLLSQKNSYSIITIKTRGYKLV